MKTIVSTAFIMISGIVLFVAAIIIVGALFFASKAKDGRIGKYRISVTRDDGSRVELRTAEDRELYQHLAEMEKAVRKSDDRIRDINKELDRFMDKTDDRVRRAEKYLHQSRTRLKHLRRRFSDDGERLAVVESARLAVVSREEMLKGLRELHGRLAKTQSELSLLSSRMPSCLEGFKNRAHKKEQPLKKAPAKVKIKVKERHAPVRTVEEAPQTPPSAPESILPVETEEEEEEEEF